MRKNFYKKVGALTLSTLLTLNAVDLPTYAAPVGGEITSVSVGAPGSVSNNVEVQRISITEMSKMENSQLINYLTQMDAIKTNKSPYLKFIGEFTDTGDDAIAFYSDENRLEAIYDAIMTRSSEYTATDTKGLYTLIQAYRLAYYVAYTHPGKLDHLLTRESKEKATVLSQAIQSNPHYGLGTLEQDFLAFNVGRLMRVGIAGKEVINNFGIVLDDYYAQSEDYIGVKEHHMKERALVNSILAVAESIERLEHATREESEIVEINPKELDIYGEIDEFIHSLANMALLENNDENFEYIINNAVYVTGDLAKYASDPAICHKTLTDALEVHERLGKPYMEAISKIMYKFDGVDYYGNELDKPALREELRAKLLPKRYSFDNGNFIVITGDKVSEEKVQKLYWAAKEVGAQFFRTFGTDDALEPGNGDDIMTAVIYNTKKEYRNNDFINGYVTDNGGIYIEKEGTFYTYERTPKESRYTLEELFRHEYTHYLQGRYVIPGLYGEGIQTAARLSWFSEGGAEMFAGATRTDGVLLRRSMIRGKYFGDDVDKYSISKLLNYRRYTGHLYVYSYALRHVLKNNHFDKFEKLVEVINSGNIDNYEAYLVELGNDEALNEEYQAFMRELYANRDDYTVPLVDDIYISNHEEKNPEEVYKEIKAVTGLTGVETEELRSQFFNTFTLTGTYTGEGNQGKEADLNRMSEIADGFLDTLATNSWSGYKTLTCYFTNYRVDESGNMQYDVLFNGLLTKELENKLPIAKMHGVHSAVTGMEITLSSQGSIDPDGILTYEWDLGDGATTTQANPTHVYTEEGEYTITLTVTDNDGEASTTSKKIIVADYLIAESEPNDINEQADGPIYHKKEVTGNIVNGDPRDMFFFEVTSPGEVTVTVTSDNPGGMNVKLYSDSDPTILAKPVKTDTALKSTFVAEPGKYYVNMYNFSGNDIAYTVNVDGPIQGSVVRNIASIEEVADVRVKANTEYTLPRSINAVMENGDMDKVVVNWDGVLDTQILGEHTFVGDIKGTDLKASIKAFVVDSANLDHITQELEPNDEFANADGPIVPTIDVTGSMYDRDAKDKFFFNVEETSTFTLTLTSDQAAHMNWAIRSAADVDKVVASAQQQDNELKQTFTVEPGKYYVELYKYDDTECDYTIKLEKGASSGLIANEPNNNFANASGPILDNVDIEDVVAVGDNIDLYYFEVIDEGEVTITVTTEMAKKMSWTLRSEADSANNIGRAVRTGDELKNTFVLQPGKHYIKIYKYEDIEGVYTLNVQGSIQSPTKTEPVIVSLEELEDVTLDFNADYTLQETIAATMDNEELVDVEVTWNDDVNTSVAGEYNFTGAIEGTDLTANLRVIVRESEIEVDETEPNNKFSKANGVFDSEVLTGSLIATDKADKFYFDVAEASELTITLNTENGDNMNWTVYSESDLKEYISYAVKNDNELKNTFSVEPGRYYLSIYKFNKEDCIYTFNIETKVTESGPKIASLETLEEITLDYMDEYTLPETVVATMSDETQEDVAVTWNDTVDTTTPGVYQLMGTVADTELTIPLKVIVEGITEQESNNKHKDANKIEHNGVDIKASIDTNDSKDIFYFDVVTEGEVTIKLTSDNADKLNWLLFNETDLKQYILFGEASETELKNTFTAEPGRYYLNVYKIVDVESEYTINVQGIE